MRDTACDTRFEFVDDERGLGMRKYSLSGSGRTWLWVETSRFASGTTPDEAKKIVEEYNAALDALVDESIARPEIEAAPHKYECHLCGAELVSDHETSLPTFCKECAQMQGHETSIVVLDYADDSLYE